MYTNYFTVLKREMLSNVIKPIEGIYQAFACIMDNSVVL